MWKPAGRLNDGLDFQTQNPTTLEVVPPSLGSGRVWGVKDLSVPTRACGIREQSGRILLFGGMSVPPGASEVVGLGGGGI